MATVIIPKTYEEWHQFITVTCQQKLTLSFIDERIQTLSSPTDHMTKQFVALYGDEQRLKTIQWFEQSKHALT